MKQEALKFLPIVAFSIVFLGIAMLIVNYILNSFVTALGTEAATYSMLPYAAGSVDTDISNLLTYILPIAAGVYLITSLPFAVIMLLGTKIIKSASYNIDIATIGSEFGSFRMIRRAFIPALFSLSMGGVISGLMSNFLYTEAGAILDVVRETYIPLTSIVSALVLLPLVLAFFAPTWILSDAGIVMHLKDKELRVRKCPDTIGVGRWWSNLLGGFTLFAVPIISFVQYFYSPIVTYNQIFSLDFAVRSLFLAIGIPLLTLAFILPLIIFHELIVGVMKRTILRVAKSLGARELGQETPLDLDKRET